MARPIVDSDQTPTAASHHADPSESWYRIGVSYKTEDVTEPWESVVCVLTWFD